MTSANKGPFYKEARELIDNEEKQKRVLYIKDRIVRLENLHADVARLSAEIDLANDPTAFLIYDGSRDRMSFSKTKGV